MQVSGDPRRPNDVQGYEPDIPTEPTGDIMMLGGLVCAMCGLLLKASRGCAELRVSAAASCVSARRGLQLKIMGWIGVFCGLSSVANLRTGQADIKAMVTTFMCAPLTTVVPAPLASPAADLSYVCRFSGMSLIILCAVLLSPPAAWRLYQPQLTAGACRYTNPANNSKLLAVPVPDNSTAVQ